MQQLVWFSTSPKTYVTPLLTLHYSTLAFRALVEITPTSIHLLKGPYAALLHYSFEETFFEVTIVTSYIDHPWWKELPISICLVEPLEIL